MKLIYTVTMAAQLVNQVIYGKRPPYIHPSIFSFTQTARGESGSSADSADSVSSSDPLESPDSNSKNSVKLKDFMDKVKLMDFMDPMVPQDSLEQHRPDNKPELFQKVLTGTWRKQTLHQLAPPLCQKRKEKNMVQLTVNCPCFCVRVASCNNSL